MSCPAPKRRLALVPAVAVGLVLVPVLVLKGQGTDEPHGEIRIDCGECHDAERWLPVTRPSSFQHGSTGFELEGAHRGASCRGCHRSLTFNHVGTACADCHQDVHRGELGPRCESCHSPASWTNQRELSRAHAGSRWPLFGTHARLDCTACHRNQRPYQFANTPATCGGCHLETFQQTANPNHVGAGFSRRCEDCHHINSTRWQGVAFSHTERFPLQEGHASVACNRCHQGGSYAATSSACLSCHQADFAAAQNPGHAGFPPTCKDCHTMAAWRPATFDHARSQFPLTGSHTRATCASCHANGQYDGTPSDCNSCHAADYAGSRNPNHQAARISRDCQSCHGTTSWRPANFDHDRTRFALTGQHTRIDCRTCHTGGRYAGTPSDCNACHNDDYTRTSSPNHQASSFPTQCQTCHNTNAWRPATVDHSSTRFPLSGQHTRVDCARCHTNGRYTGTPTDCNSCHGDDYAGTTNPNHRSAGFPTRCEDCHNTNGWRPATFDHDSRYFPIYSGTHRGKWSSCGECHVSSGNFRVFECVFCHQHSNRAELDGKHREVTGYAYQSAACLRCHSRGNLASRGVLRRPR